MAAGPILATIATAYLAGLAWTVALVVYPSFAIVGGEEWTSFHRAHSRRITWAVGPAWLLQAVGLGIWILDAPPGTFAYCIVAGGTAVAAVLLTVGIAVPAHERLSDGYDDATALRLLRSHWARTACWTVGAAVCAAGLAVIA